MNLDNSVEPGRDSNDTCSILERSTLILELVAKSERPIPISQLMRELNMPKATAHRVCRVLEAMGLLVRDPFAKGLIVGPRLFNLALDASITSGESSVRRRALRSVVDATGETCSLTIMVADELVFLDRVESESPLRLQLYAGSKVPLHCTSGGKLFLAYLPAGQRARFLNAATLKSYTDNTITKVEDLEQELLRTRQNSIGYDNEEFVRGLIGTAVPVFDTAGRMRAAVSVNVPAGRAGPEERERHIKALKHAATILSAS